MSDHSEAFVAFDTSKLRHAVAIAEAGRSGEVRFVGEIENSGAATAKLEQAIRAAVPEWSLAAAVTALMAMRGIDLVSATTFLAEIGDLSRFQTPRELMAYLGLVPSENSTGNTVKHGPITKAGNRRARRTLVECAWSYPHPPRVGKEKLAKVAAAPPAVREIAWKAQCRLSARYRALIRKGKGTNVAVTAVARELAAFIWAISREVTPARAAAR